MPWKTYQHNKDRATGNLACSARNNFAIDIPPTWVRGYSSCVEANFESRDESALISIESELLKNYDPDPDTALEEIAADYGKNYTSSDTLGNDIKVTVTSTKTIEHQDRPALYQTMTEKPELSFMYCPARTLRMIVLSRSWTTYQKRAIFVSATRCQRESRHDADIKRALESFRLIEPY